MDGDRLTIRDLLLELVLPLRSLAVIPTRLVEREVVSLVTSSSATQRELAGHRFALSPPFLLSNDYSTHCLLTYEAQVA